VIASIRGDAEKGSTRKWRHSIVMSLHPAEAVAKFGGDTPMKRPAQPEEIAPAYVFLAAPACSSYITGEILPIIGGYSGG
jgi:NAD(P)-dependent dehydrogenase (short-subunit alcohol dehydrogenase family)